MQQAAMVDIVLHTLNTTSLVFITTNKLHTNSPNSGSTKVKIHVNTSYTRAIITLEAEIQIPTFGKRLLRIFSGVHQILKIPCAFAPALLRLFAWKSCDRWASSQSISKTESILADLPRCPCNKSSMMLSKNFELESGGCIVQGLRRFFHPAAESCYRDKP